MGGEIFMEPLGDIMLESKDTLINLTEHIVSMRDVNASNDSSSALAGALLFGVTGAVVGSSASNGYIVELMLDTKTKILVELSAPIYKSLYGSIYEKTLPEDERLEVLEHRMEQKKQLAKAQRRGKRLKVIMIILLLILCCPLLVMIIIGK